MDEKQRKRELVLWHLGRGLDGQEWVSVHVLRGRVGNEFAQLVAFLSEMVVMGLIDRQKGRKPARGMTPSVYRVKPGVEVRKPIFARRNALPLGAVSITIMMPVEMADRLRAEARQKRNVLSQEIRNRLQASLTE
jgi:hypothetical protein